MGADVQVARTSEISERIRQIASGDAAAKAWLWESFAPALERRIRSRFGRDERLDCRELLHDLFVWCFQQDGAILQSFVEKNPPEAQTEYRLAGYLWGLVSGLASNRRRSQRRTPDTSSIELTPVSDGIDPELRQRDRDTALRLIDCLQGRGSRLFAYFTLRFVEGLTPDEIVQVTGWDKSKTYGMRARLNNAVKRCVEKLGLALLLVAAAGCAPESESLLDALEVSLRGHTELSDGLPLFIGEAPPSLCLRAPATVDTTGWHLRFDDGEASPASERVGRTLCFDAPPLDGEARLCADLIDVVDGRQASLGCRTVRHRSEERRRAELSSELTSLLRERHRTGAADWIAELAALETRAAEAGYPFLAERIRLLQAFFLRRSGRDGALERAAGLLGERRLTLDATLGAAQAAQRAYERATLALEAPPALERAWHELAIAEDLYERVADRRQITVAMKQAEVLWLAGSPGFARERLATAIADCEDRCRERFVLAARNTLTWLTLQDPDADPRELQATARALEATLAHHETTDDPLESANASINLAYARTRLGLDPAAALAAAAERLARSGASERRRSLERWAHVVAGLDELAAGQPARAEARCRRALAAGATTEAAIWAHSCRARALAAAGDPTEAFEAIERARLLHELSADDPLERQTPIGPGQRARDTYLAARLATELNAVDEAWAMLERLDRDAPARSEPCRGISVADWNRTLLDLTALDGPASRPLRAAREAIRFDMLAQAQQQLRRRWDCGAVTEATTRGASDAIELRAFVSEGQLVVLRRAAQGAVSVERRTQFDPRALSDRLERLERAVQERSLSRTEWDTLLAPLAPALLPDPPPSERIVVSLHGALQRVPFAALPLPDGKRVVADATVVIHRPAGPLRALPARSPRGEPLFVVDPVRNLPDGRRLARDYRRRFPSATVLHGAEATSPAIDSALLWASALHIDAHTRFDPLFPEMTRLLLADAEMPAARFVDRAASLEYVNLSVCGAARWPVTADSGRLGIAGLFARAGARWVIAARADLPHDVAVAFNARFYEALSAGIAVPEAYSRALGSVRAEFAPADWASLLLVSSSPGPTPTRILGGPDSLLAGSGE